MQNDPYAQSDYAFDGGPQRTSAMAVASLVTSLGCCLPGVGLLAIFLGVISLGFIGRSQGRLSGRAPAAIAIILGLIGTVIWAALFFGGLQAWTYYEKQMVPVADRAVLAAASRDLDGVRTEMTPDASQELDQERLEFFITSIEASQGAVQGTSTSWGAIGNAFERVYSGSRNQNATFGPNNQSDYVPVPVVLECASGEVLAWAIFSEDSIASGDLKVLDILVQMPNDEAVSLRADGPASEFVKGFGWTLLEPGDGTAPNPPPAPEQPDGSGADA